MGTRLAIVTGANRGIGRETALGLAREGLSVVMACRNLERAEATRIELVRESGNESIFALPLDLASKESIRAFVDSFRARFGRLDALVNNAGISNTREARTVEGREPIVGTNYFGTFALTILLLPLFEEGEDNRIINLVSNIYKLGGFDPARVDGYRWVKAYAVSKYMLLLFTLELAARLRGRGISVNAVHPGIVRTSIMYVNRWYDSIIKTVLAPFFVDPAEGAATSVFLACSDSVRGETGRLFAKRAPIAIAKGYDDPGLRREVWRAGMEYVGEVTDPSEGRDA